MMSPKLIAILFFWLAMIGPLFGQSLPLAFEAFQLPGGIIGNRVNSIAQDSTGFLWFGSHGGLHRYDGQRFKTYKHDRADPNSISSSYIECLLVDPQGKLWIGTYGWGLNYFDPATETNRRFLCNPADPTTLGNDAVTALAADLDGHLWVGTVEGLSRLDLRTGKFTRFRHDPDDPASLGHDAVKALWVDREGTVWVGLGQALNPNQPEGGLCRFDPKTAGFVCYYEDPGDPKKLGNHKVRAFLEDRKGNFWIGTSEQGLYQMDRASETFTSLHDTGIALKKAAPMPDAYGHTSTIYEDQDGKIWIGGVYAGINCYDPATGDVRHYDSETPGSVMFENNFVWQIFQSSDGTIWVATAGVGAQVLKRAPQKEWSTHFSFARRFPAVQWVNDLLPDRQGNRWIGTDGQGILTFNEKNELIGRYRHDPTDPRSIASDQIAALHEHSDGSIWVIYKELEFPQPLLLDRLDPATGQVRHFAYRENQLDLPTAWNWPFYRSMYEDAEGGLWIPSLGHGLIHFQPQTGVFRAFRQDPRNGTGPTNDLLWDLCPDGAGGFWLTGGGVDVRGYPSFLDHFDPQTGQTRHYTLPAGMEDALIYRVEKGADGRIWFAVFNEGVGNLDPETGQIELLNQANGKLPDNEVFDLLFDEAGWLWLSFPESIARYDPASGKYFAYDPSHSGQVTEAYWENIRNIHPAPDGSFFLTHQSGFYHMQVPDLLEDQLEFRPELVLTSLRIGTRELPPRELSSFPTPAWKTDKLKLSYEDVLFSLDLALLDFRTPEACQYEYFLEGYDRSWQHRSSGQVTYSYVPPGKYVFRARAANQYGIWGKEKAIRLVVRGPWWKTTWAYLLFGLLLIGAVTFFRHYEKNRQRFKQLFEVERARAEERQKYVQKIESQSRELESSYRELREKNDEIVRTQNQLIVQEKLASLGQLTAGIAHEIKNPLNFVTNFAEGSAELLEELGRSVENQRDRLEAGRYEEIMELIAELQQNSVDIRENGRRADRIVHGMMNHARGGSSELQSIDLNDLVEENLNLAYHSFRALDSTFQVRLHRNLAADLPAVRVFPQNLGRALLNIIDNAFYAVHNKAKTAGPDYQPELSITTLASGPFVELHLRDNGPGIPADLHEEVFSPFFTTKPTGEGNAGLGLSIAYDIVVQEHRGQLNVASEPGAYTEFVICLPVG